MIQQVMYKRKQMWINSGAILYNLGTKDTFNENVRKSVTLGQ